MTKYLNKFNGMIYWVQGESVMCAEAHDLDDYITSSFTPEEFQLVIKEESQNFKEIE